MKERQRIPIGNINTFGIGFPRRWIYDTETGWKEVESPIYVTEDGKEWISVNGKPTAYPLFIANDVTPPKIEEKKGYNFSKRSLNNLATCHPKLQRLIHEVIKEIDITIIEGHRTRTRQAQLVKEGKSQTMNSKHCYDPSRAVDIAPYPIDWNDIARFKIAGEIVKTIAQKLGIKIVWGGDWGSFKDYVHFELHNSEE